MFRVIAATFLTLFATCAAAQETPAPATLPAPPSGYRIITPAVTPTITPGALVLVGLEDRFQQSVAEGSGKAFASWFADDAVVLNNGQPAVLGRGAIAASAQWDPKQYSLTWTMLDARMGPSNDMGYTWGTYVGRNTAADGKGDRERRPLLHHLAQGKGRLEGGAGRQCRRPSADTDCGYAG